MFIFETTTTFKTFNTFLFYQVLVTAHVPPGLNPTPDRIPWMYPQYNSKLNNIFMNYTQQIVGMHFGHEHSDNFRIYHDDAGTKFILRFVWYYEI